MKKANLFSLIVVGMLLVSLATNAQPAVGKTQPDSSGQSSQSAQLVVWDETLPASDQPAAQEGSSTGSAARSGSVMENVNSASSVAVLDDFNRADGPIGPNWTVHNSNCDVSGNTVGCFSKGRATFNNAPGYGYAAEADVAVNGTDTQYAALLLNYGAGATNLFLKVQQQDGGATFDHAGCYTGNNIGGFGLGFFPLTAPFATAHMKASREGNDVTLAFTNIDGGAQPDQIYVCSGAPAPEGTRIGIAGHTNLSETARLDNFGVPGSDLIAWDKTINGEPWHDGITFTVQTSDTIVVQEVLHLAPTLLAGSMAFEPVNVEGRAGDATLTVSSPALPLGIPGPLARPEAVLWDQPLSTVNQGAWVDQDFPDVPASSSFLADDFVNAAYWEINTIYLPGDGWNGFTTLLNATGLTWQFYADCAGVPCGDPSGGGSPPQWTLTLPPNDPQVVLSNGVPGGLPSDTTLNLAAPIILPPGHWWLVFYPTMNYASYGQYGRQASDTTNGYTGQFINPGDGFGYGTAWQNWSVLGVTLQDMAFRIEGVETQPLGARLYQTSLNIGDTSFAVYNPSTDAWTTLAPYETGCQMAVRQNGDLYAYGYDTGTIDRYDPTTDTWSPVMAAPPGSNGEFCNVEITNAGEFLYTQSNNTTLWYTSGGVWNTLALPFLANAMGDYDPTTDQYVIGQYQTTNAHLIDVHSWAITDFTSSESNGEYARFSVVMGSQYYFHVDTSNIFSFDLGNPSAAPFDYGVSPGWYNSAAADRSSGIIYTSHLYGSTLARFDPATSSLTPLTGKPVTNHSSLAFVPAPVYSQVETWDPGRLRLLDWAATGGSVTIGPDRVTWTGTIEAPETITLTKWFHIEPCTWTSTILIEELWLDEVKLEQRPVEIQKLPPNLWINAVYNPAIAAGGLVNFTLNYGNTGGFENDVVIRNTFPYEAPFQASVPPPAKVDPNGFWAEWDAGSLPMGGQGSIAVTALAKPGLPVSTTITIWDGIFNHTGELADEVLLTFHVEPFVITWEKTIDGVPWTTGMQITRQTSDTFVVQEVLRFAPPTVLAGSMAFQPVIVTGGPEANPGITPAHQPGKPASVPEAPANPEAVLWDQPLSTVSTAAYVDQAFPDNPAFSSFLGDDFYNAATWMIDTIYIPGDGWNTFTTLMNATNLNWAIYTDCGGVPCGDPSGGGTPPIWFLTLPPADAQVTLSAGTPGGMPSNVTLSLATPVNLPPGHYWLLFWPTMNFNPDGQWGRQMSDTFNGYTGQFINPGGGFGYGTAWQNWNVLGPVQHDIAFRLEGDIVQQVHTFEQTETWDPAHLELTSWDVVGGSVSYNPSGSLEWSGEFTYPEAITLTKYFRLEPCTWTQTILSEKLEIDAVDVGQRPVTINKLQPALWIDADYDVGVVPGEQATFVLHYGNTGGYENDVHLRSTFPPGATFVTSVPAPTSVDPSGLWAEWNVGSLPMNNQGTISVTIQVSSSVPLGTTIQVWNGIYNHLSAVADEVYISFETALRRLFLPIVKRS